MPGKSRRKPKIRSQSGQVADLEELQPQRFFVRNMRTRTLLKGEGTLSGNVFELTTWRREGLLARLRARGFVVSTLEDRARSLPALPSAVPIGDLCVHPVTGIDRYSYFDPDTLDWRPIDPQASDGEAVVSLRDGWVIRQRHGRGAASYYQAVRDRSGQAQLTPLTETGALLAGYAQAARNPRSVKVRRAEQHYVLPDLKLPEPHRDLLQRLGQKLEGEWYIEAQNWPLARQVYERLGLKLVMPTKDANREKRRPR